jgi:hypothetical protein
VIIDVFFDVSVEINLPANSSCGSISFLSRTNGGCMVGPQDSIGVVILEPNKQLLDKLCVFSQSVWGLNEVLPRQTGQELLLASEKLLVGVVVLRSSIQRSSALIRNTLMDLYTSGTEIIFLQDDPSINSNFSSLSIAGIHYLSSNAPDEKLKELLTGALVRFYLSQSSKLI